MYVQYIIERTQIFSCHMVFISAMACMCTYVCNVDKDMNVHAYVCSVFVCIWMCLLMCLCDTYVCLFECMVALKVN